jgi:hypothetical protein
LLAQIRVPAFQDQPEKSQFGFFVQRRHTMNC